MRGRLLSELQLRFNFCTNFLFGDFFGFGVTNVNLVEGFSVPLYRDSQSRHACVLLFLCGLFVSRVSR